VKEYRNGGSRHLNGEGRQLRGCRPSETRLPAREIVAAEYLRFDLGEVKSYVDRYGHRHSAAVLAHWSPAVLRALGVRPLTEEDAP
jgi:hypothetical protein